ncbi:hypothetical protein GCM10009647_030500 [Streptomyces sanglieri]
MKLRRTMAATGLALATLTTLALGASPAGAADVVTCGTVHVADPTDGRQVKLAGTGCFHSYGDKFTLTDENSDSYHVEIWWQTGYGRTGICRNIDKAGSTVTCNYDMREGETLLFEVHAMNDGVSIMAGPRKNVII